MNRLLYSSTKNPDMFYAVNEEVYDPFFYLERGTKKYIFLDHRDIGIFREREDMVAINILNLKELMIKNKDKVSFACKLGLAIAQKYKVNNVSIPEDFPYLVASYLQSKKIKLDVLSSFFPSRYIKTDEEIENIKKSVRGIEHALEEIKRILKTASIRGKYVLYEGKKLTVEYLKKSAEEALFSAGLENTDGMIVSVGTQTAIPHHQGSGYVLANESIICDIYSRDKKTKYHADLTRTFVKGRPSDELHKMYKAVKEAQRIAISSVGPGVLPSKIHNICAKVLLDKGFHVGNKGLVHSTGHGFGLEVHEPPGIGMANNIPLKVGNVITVEPGLYYEGVGGVRIEDDILVTKKGFQILSKFCRRLIIK